MTRPVKDEFTRVWSVCGVSSSGIGILRKPAYGSVISREQRIAECHLEVELWGKYLLSRPQQDVKLAFLIINTERYCGVTA
jgi:hypothetical protein